VQGLEESYERCRLRRTQVVPISRHVAAALNNLSNELVLRQAHCNAIQGWPPLSASVAKRVAVAALLDLKYKRTLPLKCSRAVNVPVGYRIAAPCVHVWTPGRELSHASKRAEGDCDQQHSDNRNWTALPTFFLLLRKEMAEESSQELLRPGRREGTESQAMEEEVKAVRRATGKSNRAWAQSG